MAIYTITLTKLTYFCKKNKSICYELDTLKNIVYIIILGYKNFA